MATINTYDAYIANFSEKKNSFIIKIEEYAEQHHVPIMGNTAIETLLSLLSIQKPSSILEIGSAIGYSAIRMAELLPEASITTIERNEKRYRKAVDFIKESTFENRIKIIKADALALEDKTILEQKYEALFIDAAKGQYKRFFEKYSPSIANGGVIYCDNMFMHGMVLREDKDIPRRNRTMIRNLKDFTGWVMAHPEFDTSLIPIGDGMLIARKKEM